MVTKREILFETMHSFDASIYDIRLDFFKKLFFKINMGGSFEGKNLFSFSMSLTTNC